MPGSPAAALLWALLAAACCVWGAHGSDGGDWSWRQGRATWFGTDEWTIHTGGCNYGYLWADEGTGWDVMALPDVHANYVGSCGTCWEVQCASEWTQDYYGEKLDRTRACKDTSASVIVRNVDTCPCHYPANLYSNKRWCCGDREHLDLSLWAFEKLASIDVGVIALRYRPVPCDYEPAKRAYIQNPSPGVPEHPPADAKRQTRNWPEVRSSQTHVIFDDYLHNGWQLGPHRDAWIESLDSTKSRGTQGGPGMCVSIKQNGEVGLMASPGAFQKAIALEFFVYVGFAGEGGHSASVPDVEVVISGTKGTCTPVRLVDIKPMEFLPECKSPDCDKFWWKYRAYLPAFGGQPASTVINNADWFQGCGGNSAWDLNAIKIQWRNYDTKSFCLDNIQLV